MKNKAVSLESVCMVATMACVVAIAYKLRKLETAIHDRGMVAGQRAVADARTHGGQGRLSVVNESKD